MTSPTRRWRSSVPPLGVPGVVLLVAALSGCGNDDRIPDTDHGAVCVNKLTQQRVDDDRCHHGGGHVGGVHGWYYIPLGRPGSTAYVPGVGTRVVGGSYFAPAGTTVSRGGLPSAGGHVVRGGFGGRSGSVGG